EEVLETVRERRLDYLERDQQPASPLGDSREDRPPVVVVEGRLDERREELEAVGPIREVALDQVEGRVDARALERVEPPERVRELLHAEQRVLSSAGEVLQREAALLRAPARVLGVVRDQKRPVDADRVHVLDQESGVVLVPRVVLETRRQPGV